MPKFKERRKMTRRKEDKKQTKIIRTIIIDMPLDEFVCKFLDCKKSGIEIFKTISMTKII